MNSDVANCTVLTGVGAHTDRWHDLPATSAAVAGVLAEVMTCRLIDTAELEAGSLPATDLLVVNVAGEVGVRSPDTSRIVDTIIGHNAAGGAILGMHSASLAFAGEARWPVLLGGRWVPGVTDHPPIGEAQVRAAPAPSGGPHVQDFVLYDERYTGLEVSDDVEVLAFHTERGSDHPLVWARPRTTDHGAVGYDALGHGIRSYESPDHRALIQCLTRWLLSQ